MAKQLVLDVSRISCFTDFVGEFNAAYKDAFGECEWNHGPDWDGDLNDLDCFLEAPQERISIRLTNASQARENLGYEQMVEFWEDGLATSVQRFPNVTFLHDETRQSIENAKNRIGPTMFDYLVDLLSHPNCTLTLT